MLNSVCNTLAEAGYWKALACLFVGGATLAVVAYKLGHAAEMQDEVEARVYGERDNVPEIILWRDGVMVGFVTTEGDKFTMGIVDENNDARITVSPTDPNQYIVIDGDTTTHGKVQLS